MIDTINLWAILVCGVVAMVLGFLWYGPLFGKVWAELSGLTPQVLAAQKAKKVNVSYFINFVGALVMAYVFAHTLVAFKADSISMAFQGAFWMWLGFVAVVQLGKVLWEGKSWKLWCLDTSYFLVLLLINSAILVSWK